MKTMTAIHGSRAVEMKMHAATISNSCGHNIEKHCSHKKPDFSRGLYGNVYGSRHPPDTKSRWQQ